jgi:putative PIN family toxin of toxin-antitoxin system
MANKPDRIIIDTNIFVSFLITGSFFKLYRLLESHNVTLLFSEELLQEFLDVVKRPKLKKYFSEKDVSKVLDGIQNFADYIKVSTKVNVCRDANDNFLLALCYDGKADYLITGDDDLLVIKKYKQTLIVKISDYLKNKE